MDLNTQNKVDIQGGMSSMTDLVFLLLIFFIILSTLAKSGHEVNLPESKGVINNNTPVTLTINKDMQYYVNNGQPMPKSEIELRLKAIFESKAEKTLLLNIDEEVPTGATVEMIGLAKVNDWKVVIASDKKKEN
ncbi:ExbD/TolR family protein [Halocola ammonii]